MSEFGSYVREKRLKLQGTEPRQYSLRKVAGAIGIEPSYLSKIERGLESPPGEGTIVALAEELEEDPDMMLALAGKVSQDLKKIILTRPKIFAEMIRQLKDMPDHAVLRIVREVRDGEW